MKVETNEDEVSVTCVCSSPRGCASVGLLLPVGSALVWQPIASDRVTVEIAILVPVALLQQLQQGIAQRGIHSDALTREVAPDLVAR